MNSQSEYNLWFEGQLNKHQLKLFGSIDNREHEGITYLCGVAEHEDPRRVIRISNYGGEITIAIHTHHVHFDHESKSSRDGDFEEAMEWVTDVIQGRVFICTKFSGNKFASSFSTYNLNNIILNNDEHVEVLCYPEKGIREISQSARPSAAPDSTA